MFLRFPFRINNIVLVTIRLLPNPQLFLVSSIEHGLRQLRIINPQHPFGIPLLNQILEPGLLILGMFLALIDPLEGQRIRPPKLQTLGHKPIPLVIRWPLLLPLLQPLPNPLTPARQHPMIRHHGILEHKPNMRCILILLCLPEIILCGVISFGGGVTQCLTGFLRKSVGGELGVYQEGVEVLAVPGVARDVIVEGGAVVEQLVVVVPPGLDRREDLRRPGIRDCRVQFGEGGASGGFAGGAGG